MTEDENWTDIFDKVAEAAREEDEGLDLFEIAALERKAYEDGEETEDPSNYNMRLQQYGEEVGIDAPDGRISSFEGYEAALREMSRRAIERHVMA